MNNWMRYANWELEQKEYVRYARGAFSGDDNRSGY